jgi:hypothetical protein
MLIGALLCLLGFVSYSMSTSEKPGTALIPAGFGAVLLLLGLFTAMKPALRKHLMHAAAAVGTIGLLGSLVMFLKGVGTKGFVLSTGSQLAMAILCAIFVVACVRSFIAARKAREAGPQP